MCEQDVGKDPVFTKEFLETVYSQNTPADFPAEDPSDEFYSAIEEFLLKNSKKRIKF